MAMPPMNLGQQPPSGMPGGMDPSALLGQMQGMGFPPFPGAMKPGKGKKGDKEGKGKSAGKDPASQLEKAADMVQSVITGLGPQSDIGSALTGLVQSLTQYSEQLSRPQTPVPMGQPGVPPQPPLGVGTPGQLPGADMGGPTGGGIGY